VKGSGARALGPQETTVGFAWALIDGEGPSIGRGVEAEVYKVAPVAIGTARIVAVQGILVGTRRCPEAEEDQYRSSKAEQGFTSDRI
jgi:hypothetical protein